MHVRMDILEVKKKHLQATTENFQYKPFSWAKKYLHPDMIIIKRKPVLQEFQKYSIAVVRIRSSNTSLYL